jgi:hypothetical protein
MCACGCAHALHRSYGEWHQPIPALLASTAPDRVTWESAVAHRVDSCVADLLDLDLAHRGPRGDCGVALVGDAAHTHDPLLAQGAGRAIESAVGLAAAVAQWRRAAVVQPKGGYRANQCLALQDAIIMETKAQRQRDGMLQVVGDIAASMGQAGQVVRCAHSCIVPSAFPPPTNSCQWLSKLRARMGLRPLLQCGAESWPSFCAGRANSLGVRSVCLMLSLLLVPHAAMLRRSCLGM